MVPWLPNRWSLVTVVTFALLAAPARAGEGASPLRVTVSVPPLAWLVSQVAGPEVVVEHLIERDEDAESFKPTDRRITRIARSALFFRVGVPAEKGPWLRALAESGSIEVVDLRQGLDLREMGAHHSHTHPAPPGGAEAVAFGGADPHVWLSPRRLEIMAATVARHLAAVDPQRSEHYAAREAAVRARQRELDTALAARLAPVRGGSFFIFHPAWGYFADDYGLRQVAIEIEGKEPTEAELTRLMRQARALGARTLFVQPQIHSATPAALARALGARLEILDPLAFDLPANLEHAAECLRAALLPELGDP